MKKFILAAAFGLLSTTAHAAGFVSASSDADFDFYGFGYNEFGEELEADLSVFGLTNLRLSAFVSGKNGRQFEDAEGDVVITNNSDFEVEVFVDVQIQSFAEADIFDGGPIGEIRYDSNTRVQFGRLSTFASTNGTYICDDLMNGCRGDFESRDDFEFDSFGLYLGAGETETISVEGSAFAFIESDLAPVPLPASGMLLLGALVPLARRRRRLRS